MRTPRARAATADELARVFHVTVVSQRGENVGEINMTRPGESTPVRLRAVGKCQNVLNTLAQFAAISLDPAAALASAQELELPQNPYLNWNGPIAPPIPDNPYRHWSGRLAPNLPENPYRQTSAAITAEFARQSLSKSAPGRSRARPTTPIATDRSGCRPLTPEAKFG